MAYPTRFFSMAVGFVLLGAASGHAQMLPVPRSPDSRQEMREFNAEALRGVNLALTEWRQAWARNDARTAARFYTEDALLQISDGKAIQGRAAIERSLATSLATRGEIQVGVEDFTASGNLAYAFGRFWYPMEEEGTDVHPVSGTYVMVFRRGGRSWRIRSQIFSAEPTQRENGDRAPAPAETAPAGVP